VVGPVSGRILSAFDCGTIFSVSIRHEYLLTADLVMLPSQHCGQNGNSGKCICQQMTTVSRMKALGYIRCSIASGWANPLLLGRLDCGSCRTSPLDVLVLCHPYASFPRSPLQMSCAETAVYLYKKYFLRRPSAPWHFGACKATPSLQTWLLRTCRPWLMP
jgi:hypothetical protein